MAATSRVVAIAWSTERRGNGVKSKGSKVVRPEKIEGQPDSAGARQAGAMQVPVRKEVTKC